MDRYSYFVVGYLIVKGIEQNSATHALIAQQQYLNSADYKHQAAASLDYWHHFSDIQYIRIRIAERKIEMLNSPDRRTTKALQDTIRGDEQLIDDLTKEYQEKKKEYPGFQPEPMEEMKVKYNLDESFASDADYVNVEGDSKWSLYEDKNQELAELAKKLTTLEQTRTHRKAA